MVAAMPGRTGTPRPLPMPADTDPSPGIHASLDNVTVEFVRPDGQITTALRNVSLQLRHGEFLVLVGASGSGKTTALNVFAGLAEPSSGTASVANTSPATARRHLGYMFARDALLPWRTARQNVEFGMELRGIGAQERRARAMHLLDVVRLRQYADNYPSQLSQGQRQRVALARTWGISPSVLLMDEPFSALDAQTREALQEEFLRLWATEKKSIVFVTHDLNEALALADRIVVFAKGEIVHDFVVPIARPRDILDITENPEAKRMYMTIRGLLNH